MFFASDNAGPAHPVVLAALARANEGYAPGYGNDPLTARAVDLIRETFDAPTAAVHLVATGTAANSLLLATLSRPWSAIFCAPTAHINEDECNAPEFFSGGAKLLTVDAPDGRLDPVALAARIAGEEGRGVHGPKRGPVSITQATEKGAVYAPHQVRVLAEIAHGHGLPLHMDGARFANALVTLGAAPADATWRAGVDALSFGGTKNGLMGVEAAVLFDPALSEEFEYRRKRAGHLFSKHRYLAAQMTAYLEGGLWLDLAARANASCARLAEGLAAAGIEILHPAEANIIFFRAPRALHRRLKAAGAQYYTWDGEAEDGEPAAPLTARLVCDWSLPEAEVRRFLALL